MPLTEAARYHRESIFSLVQLGGLFPTVPKNLDNVFGKTTITKFESLRACSYSKSNCFGLHHKHS